MDEIQGLAHICPPQAVECMGLCKVEDCGSPHTLRHV